MDFQNNRSKETAAYKAKKALCRTVLLALGSALERASTFSPQLKHELEDWEEGFVFTMGVLPDGPYMSAKKDNGRVRFLGMRKADPDVAILFKNADAALPVFTAQIGTPVAGAQKRFIVEGNTSDTMKVARALDIVQSYLFPKLILKNILRRPPSLTGELAKMRARTYVEIVPALVANLTK